MKKDLSRRQFLHRTAGAAGALAASPTIFLEPEHIPLPLQSTPPSDRLRFGIIGVGMQGNGLLKDAIQLPGVECVAACDLYDGRHTLAQEIVGKKIPTTRRYKDLLDNKEIDCLIAAARSLSRQSRLGHLARRRSQGSLQSQYFRALALLEGIRHRPRRRSPRPSRQWHELHARLECPAKEGYGSRQNPALP